jgi:hypothetical protein
VCRRVLSLLMCHRPGGYDLLADAALIPAFATICTLLWNRVAGSLAINYAH